MFISHGIWRLRTRRLHQEAEEAGVKYDEFPPAVEWQSKGYDVGLDRLRGLMSNMCTEAR